MADPTTASILAENTRKILHILRGGSAVVQCIGAFLRPLIVFFFLFPSPKYSIPLLYNESGLFPVWKFTFLSALYVRRLSPTSAVFTEKGFGDRYTRLKSGGTLR